MTIEATWTRDKDECPWHLRLRRGSWEGLRTYIVNTDLVELALKAQGLPAVGEPWSADYPDLLVEGLDWSHWGGSDPTGTGTGGWSKVAVTYAQPRASGSFRQAALGRAYTEISVSPQTVLRRWPLARLGADASGEYPLPGSDPGTTALINGGQGAPVLVGVWTARVTTWKPVDASLDLDRAVLLSTPAHTNEDAVTLPPIYGTRTRILAPPGTLLYVGIDQPRIEQGLLQVTHTMQMARHFWYPWMRENSRGEAFPPLIFDQVYAAAPFAGLWPAT